MDYPTLSVSDIIIPPRMRQLYGDIEDFAAGIAELGHLIEPIVLNRKGDTYTLMAGGRRTKALELLGWPLRHGIEYVFKNEVSDDVALEIELAENTERLDMTWQERCMSIWKIHNIKTKMAAEDGVVWGHSETGRLCGMQKANVWLLITVAKALSDTSNPEKVKWVNGAENYRDALSRLMKWREDEGLKHIASQLIQKPSPVEAVPSSLTDEYATDSGEQDPAKVLETIVQGAPITIIEITRMLFNDKWENVFARYGDGSLDGHIITDPPYGIEMDNIQQQNIGMNIDSVRDEHTKPENLDMLAKFLPEAYRVLADKRFLVMFCDMEHFNTLIRIGMAAGFKATRWPLVWVKLHHCQNTCAQYNFTKATEDAIVFRKGDAILARPPQTNYYIGDNVAVKAKHGGHPFVKPPELWTWIASHVALKGQTIIDPFMGEASCGEAILPMGWNYLGIESNSTHYAKAVVYICDHFSRLYHDKVRFV